MNRGSLAGSGALTNGLMLSRSILSMSPGRASKRFSFGQETTFSSGILGPRIAPQTAHRLSTCQELSEENDFRLIVQCPRLSSAVQIIGLNPPHLDYISTIFTRHRLPYPQIDAQRLPDSLMFVYISTRISRCGREALEP